MEYKNIFNYLVLSVGVDGEAMENFKSQESYQYFHAFKVGAVMFKEPASDMCFLKAEVTPSQAVKATKHTAWVLVTSAGVVETAGCTCIAGQGESCSHAGAILWKVSLNTVLVFCFHLFSSINVSLVSVDERFRGTDSMLVCSRKFCVEVLVQFQRKRRNHYRFYFADSIGFGDFNYHTRHTLTTKTDQCTEQYSYIL